MTNDEWKMINENGATGFSLTLFPYKNYNSKLPRGQSLLVGKSPAWRSISNDRIYPITQIPQALPDYLYALDRIDDRDRLAGRRDEPAAGPHLRPAGGSGGRESDGHPRLQALSALGRRRELAHH